MASQSCQVEMAALIEWPFNLAQGEDIIAIVIAVN